MKHILFSGSNRRKHIMKKIFLIDGDNNINLGLRGIEMLPEDNQVMIFHSKAMEITRLIMPTLTLKSFSGVSIHSMASAISRGLVVTVITVDTRIIMAKRMKTYKPLIKPSLDRVNIHQCQ